MQYNVTTVGFSGARISATAKTALWQYDHGQILRIRGLELPNTYEVHFSNDPHNGGTETVLAEGEYVRIPDAYLLTGATVYAFIWLTSGEDDGETEYRIAIPVNRRPKPDDVDPTPDEQRLIDQLIAALNSGVETATDKAEAAGQSATEAAESATAAASSETNARASAEASAASATESLAGAYTATQKAAEAAQSASEAAGSASDAYRDAERAEQAANTAGYMTVEIDEHGHLIYTRTDQVDVNFRLSAGHLLMEAI